MSTPTAEHQPAGHPPNPWDAEPNAKIVDELERLSAEASCISNRDACALLSAADRLRRFEISQPEAGALFDMPSARPPGSFYAVRRPCGAGMGEEDAGWALADSVAHGWQVAQKEADWLDTPGTVEFEVVLMVPYRVGARCLGSKGAVA
jgi:hypothetical protein